MAPRRVPENAVSFIRDCIERGRILWTYHVNMRLSRRFIPREAIHGAQDTYELVEEYPDDKYLPSYLVIGRYRQETFHVLFAVDVAGDNVRVVTAYRPDPREWEPDQKTRRPKT
ncbi:MAG: DUF4258 domain-containing protein [Chloroflexi bacterium]|nr:DUF4258 domain-containing protein [Chloroflexota bacterium]